MSYNLAHRIIGMALSAALSAIFVGCSSDDHADEVRYATLYDVVEYAGKADNATHFTLYPPDAEKPVSLVASRPVDTGKVETGECMLLGYVPHNGEAYTSGTVDVTGVGVVSNYKLLKGKPETLTDWDTDPVWLTSLWRAGGKIAMRVQLVYDPQPRLFRLVVDESTMGDEYPDAYLVNVRRSGNDNFMRQYYVAFDVHAMWTYPTCKGLRVHVNNSNNTSLREFVIPKPEAYVSGGEEEIPDGTGDAGADE